MAAPCSLLPSVIPDAPLELNNKLEVGAGAGWVVLMVWQLPSKL